MYVDADPATTQDAQNSAGCGWVPRRGLVADGGTGVVGHSLAAIDPLTALLTHVPNALLLQLTVQVSIQYTALIGSASVAVE